MDLYKDSCFKVDDSASSMKLIPQIGAFEVSYKGFVRNLCIFIVVVLKDEEWYVAQFSTSCIEGPWLRDGIRLIGRHYKVPCLPEEKW